jgi:DNA polymerase III subunit gamma/tau
MPISRTHRPRYFKDVTGQGHITETLRKEVASGILGHAFLFSGPRGVGKTTTARIFAKALLNEKTDDGEPPCDGEASREIDAGTCIDFIELDAASHTGVENVREAIIEHVRFAPSRWKRKVYIIDECHMLSTSAWNALLKTLEEPPPYAFFILATTELHKVPGTIISRCQRFEFHRIASEALAERVRLLAKEEGIAIDEDVVRSIARASDGCVRDAESLLDQLASLGESTITSVVASLVLPTSRIPESASLIETCITRNVGASLASLRRLVENGIPPLDILNDLLAIVRGLIACEDPAESARIAAGDEDDLAISRLIGRIDRDELGRLALLLIERRRDAKGGTDPEFALELAVLAFAGSLLRPQPSSSSVPRTNPPPAPVPTPPVPHGVASGGVREPLKTNGSTPALTAIKSDHASGTHDDPAAASPSPDSSTHNSPSVSVGAPAAASPLRIDLNDLRILWNTVIREVEKENHSIPFILKITRPIEAEGERITLAFAYDFHKEKIIDDLKIKLIVERAIASVLKCDRILIEGRVTGQESESSAPGPRDIVAKVLETFGGEIVA